MAMAMGMAMLGISFTDHEPNVDIQQRTGIENVGILSTSERGSAYDTGLNEKATGGMRQSPNDTQDFLGSRDDEDDIEAGQQPARQMVINEDKERTGNNNVNEITIESFRSLGFVLRNSKDFHDPHVTGLIFGALIRCKLESSMCVWNPNEKINVYKLENIQKAFLRYLYKRMHGYLYESNKYTWLSLLQTTEEAAINYHVYNFARTYHVYNFIDASDLHDTLCKIYVSDNYCRFRYQKLFAEPRCTTVAHFNSPSLALSLRSASLEGESMNVMCLEIDGYI